MTRSSVILDCIANLRLPRATEVAVHQNNRLLPFQEGNQTKIPKGKNTYSTPRRFPKQWRVGSAEPTNKVYCFLKVGADVGSVAVLNRDPLVVQVAGTGLGGPAGNVQQGCDVQVGEELALGCMVGTSEVEEGKDFNWATLEQGQRTTRKYRVSLLIWQKKNNNPDLFVS